VLSVERIELCDISVIRQALQCAVSKYTLQNAADYDPDDYQ